MTPPRERSLLRLFLPSRPLQWFGVAVVMGLIGLAGAALAVVVGLPNLAASQPHPEGWAKLLHLAFNRSVAWHAGSPPPPGLPLDDPAMIGRGATHYGNVCANCHGGPGLGQNPVALSLRPEPPMVLDAAKHFSDNELFYIVENGVKYTAMPSWPVATRPDEVWAVVAFLKALPDMSFADFAKLAFNENPAQPEPADASARWPNMAFGTDPATFHVRDEQSATTERFSRSLPGNPQSQFASPGATQRPAIGFVPSGIGGAPLALCSQCHGEDLAGRPSGAFPNLTLQSETYLRNALTSYATGERQSGIMWPVAAQLSAPQIGDIARYIGALEPRPSPADADTKVPQDVLERGQLIAEQGLPADDPQGAAMGQAVAPCESCHGEGHSADKLFPVLAGQHADFLANQLWVLRSGVRTDAATYEPMSAIAHMLSAADIDAVSAYYASLAPRPKSSTTAALPNQTVH